MKGFRKDLYIRKGRHTGVRLRSRLGLSAGRAHRLHICLQAAAQMDASGDEALRRLKAEAGFLHGLMDGIHAQSGVRLPANREGVRVLQLARSMLNGGEAAMGVEELLKRIAAFDREQSLEMLEIQCIPTALRIAMCEEAGRLAREILNEARMRDRARRWVLGGGRLGMRIRNACFMEHALRLCGDMELPRLHAKLEYALEKRGINPAELAEQVHRAAANHCLQLDNIMQLCHLLRALDWEECFACLSAADIELNADPARVYGSMDAPSRACVREYTAELSRHFGLTEIAVAGCALRLAQRAMEEHGAQDPRSTVCWYLAEDAGREEMHRELGIIRRLRRRLPDASGHRTVALVSVCTGIFLLLLIWGMGNPVLWLYALPLAWMVSMQVIGRFHALGVKPGRLLKLKLDSVPDSARTLVVLPVLLGNEARAREMVEHMYTLGCLEKDENVDFLLLGDFRDGNARYDSGDEALLAAARQGVQKLNSISGREKYFYLHRERSYREKDGRWMGENRKRGALMALNRLLMGKPEAASAFAAEGRAADQLAGRYRYVVTLDADTEYLPGTVVQLVGTMLHPLNRAMRLNGRRRGYGVLQPCMQLMAEACTNAYVETVAGCGGMDSYPASVSDFYQDTTGNGCFAGKGIYDVEVFARATDGCLRDDAILSHDLIEGILAGAGFVNDVNFYDTCPEDLRSELKRTHRWTRGDWQLLPVILKHPGIAAVDRMKMIGNLLGSLAAPALLGLLIHSVWMDSAGAFILGILLAFLEPILHGGRRAWRRALLRLAVLPCEAACRLDAAVRTLWRLAVSRKHLMDWVPAADAGSGETNLRPAGHIAVLLLLPGLLRPFWIPAVAALAALFLVGPGWADDLSRRISGAQEMLNGEQVYFLNDLARRTWDFFRIHVPEDGCGLPPDNVQLDPPTGAALRTSPTNIGLYLMSCLSAHSLGLIQRDELLRRMRSTVCTLEGLEKWHGQLYNWYSINDFLPLRPRYVSAVDSGNLAGALLLCAHAVSGMEASLGERMHSLARSMNLAALYDDERKLFFIGMDVDGDRMSRSHYDLYASEARILSYTAMMLGQVPVEHWKHLSRPAVRIGRQQCMLSWSGTMFEYLMPELLLRSLSNTLAGQSRSGAVASQRSAGMRLRRPWGISESGYYAFDLDLNYQYRAFGLPDLALSGNAVQDVTAPYAAALALAEAPAEAADNLHHMQELGWMGELGMYEAADYMHLDSERRPRIVRSHMAHHQGMILCAICNALQGNMLSEQFMQIPEARALRLLLQERAAERLSARTDRKTPQSGEMHVRLDSDFARSGRKHGHVDAHLLHGGGMTALVTARGAAFAWKGNWQLNRFAGRLKDDHEGMFVHVHDVESGRKAVVGREGKAHFDAGSACFRESFCGVEIEMTVAVSPEDGTLYQMLELSNESAAERSLEITGCAAIAHGERQDMQAHAVFQNLFVESRRVGENALIFRRRRRTPGETLPETIYLLSGTGVDAFETDLDALLGRTGAIGRPGGIRERTEGRLGDVLNPCAALTTRLHLAPGERRDFHFALALAQPGEGENCVRRISWNGAPRRALQLSAIQMRSMLGHAGIDASAFRLFERSCALLLDADMIRTAKMDAGAFSPAPRNLLWSVGISGDLPILLVEIRDLTGMDCIRSVLRLHAFYRMMGVAVDLAIIDHHGSDYFHPSRGRLSDMLASSHLSGSMNVSGGAFVLEIQNLKQESYAAILRAAALHFAAEEDFSVQLRRMLECLRTEKSVSYTAMMPGQVDFPAALDMDNSYGGMDGGAYAVCLRGGMLPPAPWSNVLSSQQAGAIVTERGGGFAWFENSRSGRLTAFSNDALREGWGWMFYLIDDGAREFARLLPGDVPMADFLVHHAPGVTRWQSAAGDIAFAVELRAGEKGIHFDIRLENTGKRLRHLRLAGVVDWLMGTDGNDRALLRTWAHSGSCFASGAAEGVGCFTADDLRARAGCSLLDFCGAGDLMQPLGLEHLEEHGGGWTLHFPLSLQPGEMRICRFLLGYAKDTASAYALARDFRSGGALRRNPEDWSARLAQLRVETPDAALNFMLNGFLQAQTLNARIRGRTGLYQPGGAFGFRDQLQDMLPMIHYEPQMVRAHLLYCAARQFEAGDVLHWWHAPYNGVRTKISDDLLFLPYVTAQYVRITGDVSVLQEQAPFLEDIRIPEGREDIYAQMQPTAHGASLHDHCMRAFHRAADLGEHGLCRMGSGDWNDGMNRVGAEGRGESIWLSEFMAACAADYAAVAPDADDRAWLLGMNEQLCAAVEKYGWDGQWYLRAYTDAGKTLGGQDSPACRIDVISQAWAVLAGLDAARCKSALESAWEQLVDEKQGIIRLLAPPFDGRGIDPGYIAAYPPGVRENGAQYTHAACWLMLALTEAGDAARAHRALEMLLPLNHAADKAAAEVYRVEPYVMAADIYAGNAHVGRGGWTWYTGSAAWMMVAVLRLLGYERRGNRVRMHALLHTWPEVRISLKYGKSRYTLICRRDAQQIILDGEAVEGAFIEMTDDGREHSAVFPPRSEVETQEIRIHEGQLLHN